VHKRWLPNKHQLILAICLLPQASYSAIDSDFLISSCQELVAIYDKRGEERFLAGISTSVAEAMRAGICRGMLEEHSQHSRRCSADWYEQALYISSSSSTENNVERILDRACEESATK